MFPERTPLEDDIDYAFLSERFPLSGGEIKNVVLSAAAYAMEGACPVGMRHILYAIRMELEKKGQFTTRGDYEPYSHYAEKHPLGVTM